ncbi:small integral membrane protein 29-like [Haliotis rubra]|uniref:small integral membrane protein 29-like n=1 Tax=Haliotis rubra TaxID=36100 RepID=UPI001EE61BBC|nr:small integral membrane protein 29-like [Haliotis rubra]XP_046565984.1 small integral membrane protein 29-like [Haliotis rubra]
MVSTVNTTIDVTTLQSDAKTEKSSGQVLAYILIPIGSVIFIGLVIIVIVLVLKKNRLDRLRHHLMPLYSFDPGDENGDWESELLEEEREQQMRLRMESPSPPDSPKILLTSMHSEL